MNKKELLEKYKNLHYVYLHIDPTTSQIVYVGKGFKGRALDISNRSLEHRKWANQLKLLGLKPLIKVVHCFDNLEDAFIREEMLIAFLRKKGVPLFNKLPGGGKIPSGKDHPLYGKKKDPIIGRKISETRKRLSLVPWNKDKKIGPNLKVAESQKIRMLGNTIKRGTKSKEETKSKISKSLIGNQRRSETIICLNNNKTYKSIKEAWTELKLDERSVFRVLKGEWKHTKGYKFNYI